MIIQNIRLTNVGYVVDVQPIITTNLVANYDPATGISGSTFNDSSGNGYNATIYNSPTTATVNGTTVLQLNGTNQYYYYTSGYTALNGSVTFDAWFNASKSTQQAIVSEYGQAGLAAGWEDAVLGTNSSTKLAGGVYNNSTGGYIQSINTFSTGTWYNLVVTYSSSLITLYVNGISQGTLATTRGSNPSPLYYAIGYPDGTAGIYLGGGGNTYFQGYMGPVKFYSAALNQSQITQNFNALRGRYGV